MKFSPHNRHRAPDAGIANGRARPNASPNSKPIFLLPSKSALFFVWCSGVVLVYFGCEGIARRRESYGGMLKSDKRLGIYANYFHFPFIFTV